MNDGSGSMRIMLLNLQSPPKMRAFKIIACLLEYDIDVFVLSELSAGEGSATVLAALEKSGYQIYWRKPERRDFSVALAIRGVRHRAVAWPSTVELSRFQILRLRIQSQEFAIFGTYFPALNKSNLTRRRNALAVLEPFLRSALANKDRCVMFGGDINDIPTWHRPRIYEYSQEGHIIGRMSERLGLADLNRMYLPALSYSWYDRYGAGQLLDGMYISDAHKYLVDEYYLCDEIRVSGLSDHAGLVVGLKTS